MNYLRQSKDRGHANFGWLDTHHTFSFGSYHDPRHMGFGPLRVINEDVVSPGQGFGTHGHRDMEIITLVIEGALAHRDSLGTGSEILPGEVQRMSAGTGIRHSEFNASETAAVRFLQIWIEPDRQGLTPAYEQRSFSPEHTNGRLGLLASGDDSDDAVLVHQDVALYGARLAAGDSMDYELRAGRQLWLQTIAGALNANDQRLLAGDGLGIRPWADEARSLTLSVTQDSHLLLFDMGSGHTGHGN